MANEMARRLRRNQTIAEERLWKELRQLRRQGFHFRRQVAIDDFIVDFVCFSQRLVIEVDGVQHYTSASIEKDAKRDAQLEWRGYKVLRFTNTEVADALEGVLLAILVEIGLAESPA